MGKGIFTGLILLLCAFCAQAQNTMLVSQSPPDKSVPLLFEKTYLHTDRDVYAQGDTLWFKAYLVNAQDNKPVNSSKTLYIELIAPDSAKIIDHEIIRLDNGLGNGDFALTDTLKAGNYRLRAYTNWMRNFGDNFIFEKIIALLDIQSVPVAPDPKVPANAKTRVKKTTTVVTTTATPTTTAPATPLLPIIHFYPEGGSLVQGISSLVAVKAEDGYSKGIPVSGAVISAVGDTVSRFSCDSLGMGLFALLPIPGQSYHALVNPVSGGLSFRQGMVFELPSALSKGLTLQVKQADSVIHAVVNVVSDNVMMTAANHPLSVGITVKHSGKTVLSRQLTVQGTQTAFKLGTASLPEGISAVTIYDSEGKPECERLVYIHHSDIRNKVAIATNKKSYQSKEQVIVSIDTQPNANLSMAVVDAGIVPEQTEDIVSYLQLQSEVKGNIENARRYFDTTNVNRFKQLDLLLMTQGWRDFIWRRLADTAIRISYAAETGISVPGRIWEEVRNKMLPNLNVSLHADGARGNKLFSAITDSAGRFHFDGLILYGQQRIQLSSTDDIGKNKGTIWLDTIKTLPIRPVITRPAFLQNPLDSLAAAGIDKRVKTMKVSKLFGITRLKEVTIREKQTYITRSSVPLATWGPSQIFTITPKDYQYKTLEWYILQNVKGAVKGPVYYQDGAYTTFPDPRKDFIPVTGIFFPGHPPRSGSPLIPPMLVVNNQELYMDEFTQAEAYRNVYFPMPLNKFKKIEVRHMIGGMGLADYFLLYLTMQDNYTIDNPGFLITEVPGYYQARTFYSPPSNSKPSLADYRTTIHWDPYIKTDAAGKAIVSFYNALPQTNVRIIVRGITDTGIPLASTADYMIK